jgi:hypothetical protein
VLDDQSDEMRTPLARAADAVANHIVRLVLRIAHDRDVQAGDVGYNSFMSAKSLTADIERFIREVVRDELGRDEPSEKTEKEQETPRRRNPVDDVVAQGIKQGIRRARTWLENVEGQL